MLARMLIVFAAVIGAHSSQAAINYIGEEEAEAVRLCHYYRQQLEDAKSGIRDATVAGGQKLGSAAQANAVRTKLRFKKKYLEEKIAEACDREGDSDQDAEIGTQASASE